MTTPLRDFTDAEWAHARRRTVVYNYSAFSPLHLSPSGVVKAQKIEKEGGTYPLRVTWAQVIPNRFVREYQIPNCDGITRIGISVGLVATHQQNYDMSNPDGTSTFIYMYSSALVFSTAALLAKNDLSQEPGVGTTAAIPISTKTRQSGWLGICFITVTQRALLPQRKRLPEKPIRT